MQEVQVHRPSLEDYLIRLELALEAIGKLPVVEIVTSKDTRVIQAAGAASLNALAEEVSRWSAPFDDPLSGLQTSTTIAGPGAELGPVVHLDGDAVRFVLHGSMHFRGVELTAGDWMFVPAGQPYRLRVGFRGLISLTAVFRPERGWEVPGCSALEEAALCGPDWVLNEPLK